MTQPKYTVKPTSECIDYIECFGPSASISNIYKTIPGDAGLVYKLANEKVVLVPSEFKPDYPGLIFESEADLDLMIKSDFFPISEKYMTIWEIERNRLSGLPQNIESFKKYLLPELSQNNVEFQSNKFGFLPKFI